MKLCNLLTVTLLFLPLSSVRAGLFISFTPDGSSKHFSVNLGQTERIPVYLREDTTTSYLKKGLYSGAFKLNVDELNTATFIGATLDSPAWDGRNNVTEINPSGLFVRMIGYVSDARIKLGDYNFAMDDTNSILIGTIDFKGLAPGVMHLSTADYSGQTDVTSGQPVALDKFVSWGAQTTLTTVPEPGTLVLGMLGIGGMGLAAGLRRLRSRSATKAVVE